MEDLESQADIRHQEENLRGQHDLLGNPPRKERQAARHKERNKYSSGSDSDSSPATPVVHRVFPKNMGPKRSPPMVGVLWWSAFIAGLMMVVIHVDQRFMSEDEKSVLIGLDRAVQSDALGSVSATVNTANSIQESSSGNSKNAAGEQMLAYKMHSIRSKASEMTAAKASKPQSYAEAVGIEVQGGVLQAEDEDFEAEVDLFRAFGQRARGDEMPSANHVQAEQAFAVENGAGLMVADDSINPVADEVNKAPAQLLGLESMQASGKSVGEALVRATFGNPSLGGERNTFASSDSASASIGSLGPHMGSDSFATARMGSVKDSVGSANPSSPTGSVTLPPKTQAAFMRSDSVTSMPVGSQEDYMNAGGLKTDPVRLHMTTPVYAGFSEPSASTEKIDDVYVARIQGAVPFEGNNAKKVSESFTPAVMGPPLDMRFAVAPQSMRHSEGSDWMTPQSKPGASLYLFDHEKYDRVLALDSLCVAPTGQFFRMEGPQVCSQYGMTSPKAQGACDREVELAWKEAAFPNGMIESLPYSSFQSIDKRWIEGTTLLQNLDGSCRNIAHFLGRIFTMHHASFNSASYGMDGISRTVLNVHGSVKDKIMDQTHDYHAQIMRILSYPSSPRITESLDEVLRLSAEQSMVAPGSAAPVFITDSMSHFGGQAVCFRKALIPAFLKGRFFIDDEEYPARLPSTTGVGAAQDVKVPQTSLVFRSKFDALMYPGEKPRVERKIVLLDRKNTGNARRVLSDEAASDIMNLLERQAAQFGFSVERVFFEDLSFREQVDKVRSAALAVGVHGANLVNTFFMRPLTAMIEIFPYGFNHDMYVNGGNAGIKYFKYELRTGAEFPQLAEHASREMCVHHNKACKIFYRDQDLMFTREDYQHLETTVQQALTYLVSQGLGN
ncbi:hypothetical protein FVE85_1535 [Porphyridium purpureum]|uniref:Glycosyltransferase 61 catalytic domain-containing protein n=1 Tax=Porphyridium purpureum TaxID=35688 RepID=A0A5J4YWP7_PORPP|nr:hypothetical protein FVE85_1535 [Porphyridium purpureum]|eukprot:POR6909..scf209_3